MPNAPSPNFAIVFSALMSGAETVLAVGDCIIPNPIDDKYARSTAVLRGERRTHGLALTPNSDVNGSVSMQQFGTVDNDVSGLGAGPASWVRVSTTGRLERCDPADGDDIVGYAEDDGTTHLCFGVLTATTSMAGTLIGLENIGAGEGVYAGTLAGIARLKSFTGTGVAVVTTDGATINVHVPAAVAGLQEGISVGADGEDIYTGLDPDAKLKIKKARGTGLVTVTTDPDGELVINVDPVDVEGITIDGPVGGMTLKTGDTSLNAIIGTEGQIPRVIDGLLDFEDPVDVPEGDAGDMVGLDGLGGLVSLGPPSGGGGGGGGTSNVVLGGAVGQLLYKVATDLIGGTVFTYASNVISAGASGIWTFGASLLATIGKLRFSNALGSLLVQRNAANTGNETLIATDTDRLIIGADDGGLNRVPNTDIWANERVRVVVEGNVVLSFLKGLASPYIERSAPSIGGGGKPYADNGDWNVSGGVGAIYATASTSALSRMFWKHAPGSTGAYILEYTVPLPTTALEAYWKFVDVPGNVQVRYTTGVDSVLVNGPASGVLCVGTDRVRFG